MKRLIAPALLMAALVLVQASFATLPVVTISEPTGPTPGGCGAFTFSGTATDVDADIATTDWDFDYDGTFTAQAQGLTPDPHAFATPGTKTVALRVTDGDVGDAIDPPDVDDPDEVIVTRQVVVANAGPPTAVLAAPSDAQIGEQVIFSAATSTDPDGGPLTFQWDVDGVAGFDAGRIGPTITLPTGYATAGIRTIRVRATDNCGSFDDAAASINISNTGPQADLKATPNPVRVGTSVRFDASGSTDLGVGGSIVKYDWDLDGAPGFELTGTAPTMTKTYASAGTVIAQVRVTDNDGGSATTFVPLTIQPLPVFAVNSPPVASFRVTPASPLEGSEVAFLSTASDPEGRLASQKWDLDNDGQFDDADGPVASKVMKKGSHLVRLRVTDAAGAAATSSQTVTVRRKPLRNPPDVQSSVRYSPRSWGIVVSRFSVKVPSKTRLAVSCKGRGCPHGTFRKSSRKKSALLVFPRIRGNLRAGARITLIFTRPGYITGWDTITIRGGNRQTVLREGCKLSTAKKQKRCP